jgi:CO/xanthine dehydrogenase Mo-binding subunit
MDFLQPSSWDEALAVRAERPDALPVILDMPPMQVELGYADPHAPYGVRGVGEPPTISSGPAVAAAIRAVTGRPVRRVPVRPEHLVD